MCLKTHLFYILWIFYAPIIQEVSSRNTKLSRYVDKRYLDLNQFETKNFPGGKKIQISAAPIRCMDSSSMTETMLEMIHLGSFLLIRIRCILTLQEFVFAKSVVQQQQIFHRSMVLIQNYHSLQSNEPYQPDQN